MKLIQNNQKSVGKSMPAYEFENSQEKKSANKKSRLLPNVCKKKIPYRELI
jgi:hypothetical protein